MSIKMSVESRNIKFRTTYRFVFLPQIQPGGLFQVNEFSLSSYMIVLLVKMP